LVRLRPVRAAGRPGFDDVPVGARSLSKYQGGLSSVDGSRVARGNSAFWRIGRVRSSVRPVDAAIEDCWP
jgi:hypothetical protein